MPPESSTFEELPVKDDGTAGSRLPPEPSADPDTATLEEPPQTASRTRLPKQADRHFFGIKQDAPPHGFVFTDDYDKRFPNDPYGQETSAPNARVWRVYMEEAAAFDANMVGQSRDGLDVMLVFAGLFSAVVTSFLVQVSQNLQADYGEMTVLLLHDLVFIQLAMSDGVSVTNITSPSVNPTAPFVASRIDVLVNGFWVVSLSASLAVALAAVLIKQWLHHYMDLHSGTPRHRSLLRHFRFTGLELWRVRVIIGMLPIIMHLSLMLFLSGLILFYIPLHASLAWAVGVITVVLCTLYLVSNALPIFFSHCPYQTLLSDFLNYACWAVLLLWHSVRRAVERPPWSRRRFDWRRDSQRPKAPKYYYFESYVGSEGYSVGMTYDEVSVDALDWLYTASSNPVVERIVLMAIGGLPASVEHYAASTWHDALRMQLMRRDIVMESTQKLEDDRTALMCLPDSQPTLERVFRSYLFLPIRDSLGEHETRIVNTGNAHFDLVLALTPMVRRTPNPFEMRELFISSHGTAVHPLVWKKLITLAASNGTFRLSDSKVTAGAHARFIAFMLPDFALFPHVDTTSPTVLRRALEVCPPPAIWDYLSQMPALMAFDVGPSMSSSISHRVLLVASKFALYHIKEGHTLPELDIHHSPLASEAQYHWTLLEAVLRYFKSAWHHLTPALTQLFRDELMQLMEQIIALDTFRFLDSPHHTPSVPMQLLDGCISSVLALCDTYNSRQSFYSLPPINPTLLHVAVSRLLYSSDSPHTQYQMDYASCCSILHYANSMMDDELLFGRPDAYCLFVGDEWLKRLGPLWMAGWDGWVEYTTAGPTKGEWTIDWYVTGLEKPSLAVFGRQFIDYLYEPDNLAIAACVVFPDAERLRLLIAINPTHSSWDGCRALMESIVSWNKDFNRDSTEFPGDYLLGSKVIQCSDRPIPVGEYVRRRFTGEDAREKLEAALQILPESNRLPDS